MSDTSKNFAIRRLATAALGGDGLFGTPVVVPIECSQVVIENGDAANAQAVRTDPNDGGTEKTLPASLELTIRTGNAGCAVFQPGEVVCRVAPAAGNGPIIVSFIR